VVLYQFIVDVGGRGRSRNPWTVRTIGWAKSCYVLSGNSEKRIRLAGALEGGTETGWSTGRIAERARSRQGAVCQQEAAIVVSTELGGASSGAILAASLDGGF